MSDEAQTKPVETQTAASSPPQEEAPAAAVASPPPAAETSVETPAAARAPQPIATPTLLEKETAPAPAAAPKEASPKEGEPKPATEGEPAPAAEAAPLAAQPVAYEYQLPETLTMDDAQKGEFNAALDAFRADPAKGAQGILDMGAKMLTDYSEALTRRQFETFADTCREWENRVLADPVIGGAGHQTAMQDIARARDTLVPRDMLQGRKFDDGSPRLSEFDEFLRVTGVGSHPVFLRILHNAASYVTEPQARSLPTNIGIPKGNGQAPGRASLYEHARNEE